MAITDDDKARVIRLDATEHSIHRAARRLAWLKERGSSLTLDWGEDTAMWECSVISGGDRFTGVARDASAAVLDCYERVLKRIADNL
jgi:hypothetical protein